MERFRSAQWWCRLGIALLMCLWLGGSRRAGVGAAALAVVQTLAAAHRTRSGWSLPTQVRISELALVVAGLWGPLEWVRWFAMAQAWAGVAMDCCPLTRLLAELPWNHRRAPTCLGRAGIGPAPRARARPGTPCAGRSG